MNRRCSCSAILFGLILIALLIKPAPLWGWVFFEESAKQTTTQPSATSPPRLAVVIVIDQLRGDYLDKFDDLFVADGFRRLMDQGVWYRNCHYLNGVTITGPGHAQVNTGAEPRVHGIVGNNWVEVDGQKFKKRKAVTDTEEQILGGAGFTMGKGASPRALQAPGLSASLKKQSPDSRVYSVALKDRSAIMQAGLEADGAFWWDTESGHFLTSTYYSKTAPDWLTKFNGEKWVDRYFPESWNLLLPLAEYNRRCEPDDASYEWGSIFKVGGNTFPKKLNAGNAAQPDMQFYDTIFNSPAGNELTFEVARRLVREYKLGQRGVPDLLYISLSSNDGIGHVYGPDSFEVMDITVQTDRQLAGFFKFLDEQVGATQYVVALTGDHGVSMVPELAKQKGLSGGRFVAGKLSEKMEEALVKAFGSPGDKEEYVESISEPWIYINPQLLQQHNAATEQWQEVVRPILAADGAIERFFFASEIESADFADREELERMVYESYFSGRSGQVYMHFKEHYSADDNCANHGTAHPYDTWVPLIFWGSGIKAEQSEQHVSPADLAPTVAKLLAIPPPPQASGQALADVKQ
ncbi:MAG: Alkaline phosphatase PhoV [Phycisphaerae bacterium]|nr:Alkaline phosphatase PhoV [Phycisphaerae bacterium]